MDIYEYTANFKRLIARERNAEIDFYTEEIKNLKPHVREKKGRCLTQMSVQRNPRLESESIFRFTKTADEKLPHNEFSIGSNVLISIDSPLTDSLKGVVTGKSGIHIDCYISSQSHMLKHKGLRIDLFVNDTTYQVQNRILDDMKLWTGRQSDIRDIILHAMKPRLGTAMDVEFFDTTLNGSQRLAVTYAMREDEFYLIQGPPGTGKTKTSVEIIRQHLKDRRRILVTADSNIAVDNIMLGLLGNVDVMRIGESPKILPEIQKHTFSSMLQDDIRYRGIEEGMRRISDLRSEQREHLMPNRKNARGLSYFQIRKLAERNQSDFGISNSNMRSMTRWIIAQEQIKSTRSNMDKIRDRIIRRIIDNATVICTTNTNATNEHLNHVDFDLVLIDEAGQSTEPSCLIPISKAKKVILVGDHKQLPPTILSEDAKELSVSLFERMFGHTRYTLLDTQYRMHPLINRFSSDEFYASQLKSFGDNITHRLDKSPFEKNVIFIECRGKEQKHRGATSYYNQSEIGIVFDLIVKYSGLGVGSDDIGIISPYSEQVRKLIDRMPFIEIKSIDGFQGREKRLIIISLVRSNDEGDIGFLKDLRRLNVALTRAQCELVVIGNPETVSSEPTYRRFLGFVKKEGMYIKESELEGYI